MAGRVLASIATLGLGAALITGVALAAPESKPAAGAGGIHIPVEKYELPNGLEVILSPEPQAATVATNIWYHVGAINERTGQTGFAHLFEHMMFEGSGHVPEGKIDTLTEPLGAYTNASTHLDYTNYVIPNLPPEQLELALWIESDRMGFLLDRLDARNLANQKAVVRNERRQNWEQSPYGLTYQAVYQELFPAGHPYHGDVIGSHTDIAASRLDDVRAFFRTYYVPNNATLAITGKFDPARARGMIERYFGTLPRGADVPAATPAVPTVPAEKRLRLTDDVELPKLTLAWLTPKFFAPGDADADVLAQVLGGDESSLLYSRLVRDKKIAQSVSAYQESNGLRSAFQIEVVAAPGHAVAELQQEVDAVLADLRARDLDSVRLEAAKNNLRSSLIRSVEAVGDFDDRADTLNLYNHYVGNPDYLDEDIARHQAVTAQSLREFATTYLSDKRVVIDTEPGKRVLPPDPAEPAKLPKATKPTTSAEPWRNTVPGAGPEIPTTLPQISSFALPNGMRVFTVPMGRLPLVTASVVSLFGSGSDPAGHAGLAELLGRAMREGDVGRTSEQTAADVAALGAQLTSAAARDGLTISLQLLTDQTEPGLSLLADLVRNPALREADVVRVQDNLVAEIRSSRDDVAEVARGAVLPLVYGAGHPYDHMPIGTPGGVRAAKVEDLRTQYARSFTPANSALVLTGDIDATTARRLAEGAFGTWQGTAEKPTVPGPARPSGPRLAIVDVPGATQTAIRLALPGYPRVDDRYDPLAVGNQILGGWFTSRLNANLREDKGYTYGAFSALNAGRGPAPFVIGTPVEAKYTG
ncbi:MAG TPA: pitrilysin family protein, partial [Sporichthya sp.]|nr:pitrilysin family protein [Sporichthya sp.]